MSGDVTSKGVPLANELSSFRGFPREQRAGTSSFAGRA